MANYIDAAIEREVEAITGWERPELDTSDLLGFLRRSHEHQRRIRRWLEEHPEQAVEIRARGTERAIREHSDRIAERLAEWNEGRRSGAAAAVVRFLHAVGVGERTSEAVAGGVDATPAVEAARAWAATPGAGALLLLGPRGTGKTVAAAWALTACGVTRMLRCFCDACRGMEPGVDCLVEEGHQARVVDERLAPHHALFVKAAQLASALHRPGGDDLWHRARKVRVLVIDDLGREYADQHGRWLSELDLLIDDRHEARLRTVMTGNVTPEEFKARYGERIADRIRQDGRVSICNGASLRRAVAATRRCA